MKTTEIIERLLAHPDSEEILEKLENRLAEECQTPVGNVLRAYLDRDVEAMFAAFTGYGMKEFLAVAKITPDTQGLFGGRKEDALFQDVTSVETPDVHICPTSNVATSQQPWIPVSSGVLPNDSVPVHVTYLTFDLGSPCCDANAYRHKGEWYWTADNESKCEVEITAWKPIEFEPYLMETGLLPYIIENL